MLLLSPLYQSLFSVLCPSFSFHYALPLLEITVTSNQNATKMNPTLLFPFQVRVNEMDTGNLFLLGYLPQPLRQQAIHGCHSYVCLLYTSPVDECENVQPDSSSEVSIEEIHSNDNVLERYDEVSLFTMSTMCHITLLMYFPISS